MNDNNYVDVSYNNKIKNIKILNKFDDFIYNCKENFHLLDKKIKLIAHFNNENLNYEVSNIEECFKCSNNKNFIEFEIIESNKSNKIELDVNDLKKEIVNLQSENLNSKNEINK